MASGETMVHDPLMTNASPMALHAMMPIVAAFMREVRENPPPNETELSHRWRRRALIYPQLSSLNPQLS